MAQKHKFEPDPDNVKGAAALMEISAMARVSMLGRGAKLNEIRASQMDRDAARLIKRKNPARAGKLHTTALDLRKLGSAMAIQQEKEQIRPMLPKDEEFILQGRATNKGRGSGKLRVVLTDKKGKVLAETISGENGAFTLRSTDKIPKDVVLKVVNDDGKTLGDMPAPKLHKAQTGFVNVPLEALSPRS